MYCDNQYNDNIAHHYWFVPHKNKINYNIIVQINCLNKKSLDHTSNYFYQVNLS